MSDLASESLESLQSKLSEYKSNFDVVVGALQSEPGSKELQKLKADLEEVISFFTDLVALKRESAAELTAPAEPSTAAVPAPAALALIGRTCVSTGNGADTLHFGTITALGELDPSTCLPLTVRVKWFSAKHEQRVNVTALRLLSPMPPESVTPHMKAQALFSEDGQWYPCTVDRITEAGTFEVTYIDYGNQETVPQDRLRPAGTHIPTSATHQHAASASSDQRRKTAGSREVVTPAGYKIPANLVVRPGDSEAQKAEKRRRINKLKREQKHAAEEEEARARQTSWKNHAKKSMSHSANRIGTALLKGSLSAAAARKDNVTTAPAGANPK